MAYQCRDCSFSRNGPFAGGKCPACGSFDISGGAVKIVREKSHNSRLRMVLLIALWGALIVLIYQKLQS